MRNAITAILILASFGTADARERRNCQVPMADWQPKSAVQAMAEQKGWTVRRIKIDDGCYEIYATDARHRPIEVKLNPSTLEVLRIEYERFHD